jgi:prepilin-type N-terminal cleavage/methylation domain-containing protein
MSSPGHTLVEVLIAITVLCLVAALATPSVLAARDDARARSAADYVASLFHLARLEALKRHVNVAVRFEADGASVRYAMYADGNRNGVRSADIDDGIDPRIRPAERVEQHCPGVTFAIDGDARSVDGEQPPDVSAIQLGRSRMVSFSPLGTSSSGTVYLLGRGHRQFAVRVLGPTGRIRTMEYNFGVSAWQPR